ncbi:HET-domain-containing protein [Thozetella sp. PMI_491]|nr:HET-domain-containing protein [Thozetella sp. PMI_491]
MRLINTQTGSFEEFTGRDGPHYAILSHTWEEEEFLFKEMGSSEARLKQGYKKVAATCLLAHQAELQYAWVDTYCIDKSSSAELNEAINSMFRWYQRSTVCYVYLADLVEGANLKTELPGCKWFTRGWTLQELIAPHDIIFFDREWNKIGSKGSLMKELSIITGIDIYVLEHKTPLSYTTRIEDTAYCMLGLFGVHMPMLYGEEERAFWRLQEEIIKMTPDYSIFAWNSPSETDQAGSSEQQIYSGLLATSPRLFSESGTLASLSDMTSDFTVSNRGIKLRARVYIRPSSKKRGFE